MSLVDWAARWEPVPDDRPALVWLPAQPTPATGGQAPAAATCEPRSRTLTLGLRHREELRWAL